MARQSWLRFPKRFCKVSFSDFLQGHIGTNVNYLCAIIISIHTMLSFGFSRTE